MKRLVLLLLLPVVAVAQPLTRAERLVGPDPFPVEVAAPPIARQELGDIGRFRAYPEQPPIIPHEIDGYQITLNANKCLTCHSRRATAISGAPMVSVTHYVDRSGQTLAQVAPRRHFCTQCHVTQHQVRPLVGNTFTDVTEVADE